VNIQQQQLMSTLPFMDMLQDIAPGCKSTCGLSNISNGPPDHLRPILNQTYMIMLERHGMYSCILDAFDSKILDIAKGRRPDIVELVHKVEDGAAIDLDSLSKEMQDYVKTAKVILGQTLFSDSWLEV
jgi:5-methyltetrahydrofolate corrinoid/iron sulfur protein methyltransferase